MNSCLLHLGLSIKKNLGLSIIWKKINQGICSRIQVNSNKTTMNIQQLNCWPGCWLDTPTIADYKEQFHNAHFISWKVLLTQVSRKELLNGDGGDQLIQLSDSLPLEWGLQ